MFNGPATCEKRSMDFTPGAGGEKGDEDKCEENQKSGEVLLPLRSRHMSVGSALSGGEARWMMGKQSD